MLLRLAYLGIANAFALLRLLPGSARDKDTEILALRHQLAVLHRQLGEQRVRFEPADRAWFADYGTQCGVGDCSGAVSDAEIAELPGMGQNVAALVGDIKARSPRAKIVMTGYGSMLTAGANAPGVSLDQICEPGFFSSQERVD
jgi:hypothetical protein